MSRPTTYKPEYGVKILEAMSQGYSLVAAASMIDVHRRRVYDWMEVHEDFAALVELGKAKRQLFLETRLMKEEATGPQTTANIFALKNASADWREDTKQQLEVSGPGGQPLFQTIQFAILDSREPELKTIDGSVLEDE